MGFKFSDYYHDENICLWIDVNKVDIKREDT